MVKWQCETCGAVYAEYVNGCPKCWHGDPPANPEPNVLSKVVAVEIAEIEGDNAEQEKQVAMSAYRETSSVYHCLNCNRDYDHETQGAICPHESGASRRDSLPPWTMA